MSKLRMGSLVAGAALLVLVLSACDPGKASVVTSDATTFAQAGAIAMVPGGGEYVVDPVDCVIRKIDTQGVTTTVVGTGTCGYSGDGGPATAAEIDPGDDIFAAATGHVALDSSGNLYFTDSSNARIRKVDTSGTITTIAGDGSGLGLGWFPSDVCSGTTAYAGGITVTPDGTVYVACPYGIGKVRPDGTLQQVLAANPSALTSDANGILYFGDYFNERIQSFDPSTGTVTTISDFSASLGAGSQQAIATDLAVGADGTVFAAFGPITFIDGCTVEYCASYYTADLQIVTRIENGVPVRIAGTGDPDPATGAQTGYGRDLSLTPYGIAVSGAGGLLISSGHTVYRIDDAAKAGPDSGSDCSADFHAGADFSGQDLSGKKLTRCDLSGIDFTNANFAGADLTNSDLSSSTLTGATFTGAILTNTRGTSVVGTPATMPPGFAVVGGTLVGPGVDLSNQNLDDLDFSGLNVAGANLSGAHLLRTSFVGADLTGANLSAANLQLTDFTGANLTGADLENVAGASGCVARGADFTNADLTNAHMGQGTYLCGPVFTGANVAGADLTGLQSSAPELLLKSGGITGTPQLPAGMKLVDGYLVGKYTDLTGADLTGADLSSTALDGSDFTGATLTNANLSHVHAWFTVFTGADLTGANLDAASLSFAELTGADLSEASAVGIFSDTLEGTAAAALPTGISYPHNSTAYLVGPGVKLNGDDLTGLDLSGIDLTGADLTSVRMNDANVSGTNFTSATVTRLQAANVTGVAVGLPSPWVQRGGIFIGPTANLRGRILDGIDVTGVDFSQVSLEQAAVKNLDLSGVDLSTVTFKGAYLTNVNLSGANLSNVNLTYGSLSNVDLHGATVQGTNFSYASVTGLHADVIVGIVGALPTGWKQRGSLLVGPGAALAGTDLSGVDLSHLSLDSSDLAGADLSNADLTDTRLNGSDLTGTNFTGANLTDAGVWQTTVTDATFAGATVTGLSGSMVIGSPASLPAGWSFVAQTLMGPGANLQWTDLTGADLTGVDLTGADLSAANLAGTNFAGTDLTGARAIGVRGAPINVPSPWHFVVGASTTLVGPGANVTGADLSNANLTGLDLAGADLTNSYLANTILSGATLDGVTSSGLKGTPAALPTGWKLIGGFLVGKGAQVPGVNLSLQNLSGMDLSGADLSGASLSYANVTGANLTGTNLQGASLNRLNARNITGTPVNLPAGWTARSGFLFGPTANLINANLTGLNLSGLTLTGTRLDSALLGGANLAGTTFATSTGTPTGGSTATYANTTCPDAAIATSPATCVGHGFGS
jgi:uncharacterized protein YjbI with pentapeptide repeats